MVGGAAALARDQPRRGRLHGPTAGAAVGAGDEGAGAAAHLDTPAGTGRDGDVPVDEVDGPLVPTRGTPAAVLPAVRRLRGLPAQLHPSEATLPGGPVLVPSRPRDASLPTAPALHVLRAEAPLGLGLGRRGPVSPTPPVLGHVPEAASVRVVPGEEVGRRIAVAATIAGLAAPVLVGQVLLAAEPPRPKATPVPTGLPLRVDAAGLGTLVAGPLLPHPPTQAAGANVGAAGLALRQGADVKAEAKVPRPGRLRTAARKATTRLGGLGPRLRLLPTVGLGGAARLVAGATALGQVGPFAGVVQGPDAAPVEGAGDQGAGVDMGVGADPPVEAPPVHQDQAPIEAPDALLVPTRGAGAAAGGVATSGVRVGNSSNSCCPTCGDRAARGAKKHKSLPRKSESKGRETRHKICLCRFGHRFKKGLSR